jgi:hypothetical protein
VVAVLVILGCNPQSSIESKQITIIPSPPQTAITILQTSIAPTLLSPTQIPIIQPSITEVPALPAEEAEAKLLELLKSNGGCQLPCFWGLAPGQVNKETAISFLHQFLNISPGVEITIPRKDLRIGIKIFWGNNQIDPPEILSWIKVITKVYTENGNEEINVYNNPYYKDYFQYFTLPYLLTNYGKPKNIYISLETDYVKEIFLFLDYTDMGWVAMLTMPMSIKGDLLEGCPAQAFSTLWLWSPEDARTAQKFGFTNPKSITEATNMSLEEFYKKYKEPTYTDCLEIPQSVWP